MSTSPSVAGGVGGTGGVGGVPAADPAPRMGDKRKLYVMEQQQQLVDFQPPKKQLLKSEAEAATAAAGAPPPSALAAPIAAPVALAPVATSGSSTHSQALDSTVLRRQNQMLTLKLAQMKSDKEHAAEALRLAERTAANATQVLAMVDGHWRQCHAALVLVWTGVTAESGALRELQAAHDAAGAVGAVRSLVEAAGVPWLKPAVAHANGDAAGALVKAEQWPGEPQQPTGGQPGCADGGTDGGDDAGQAELRRLDAALVARATEHQTLIASLARVLAAIAAREQPAPPAAESERALTAAIHAQLAQPATLAAARAQAAASAEHLTAARALADKAHTALLAAQRDASRLDAKCDELRMQLAAARSSAAAGSAGAQPGAGGVDACGANGANGATNGAASADADAALADAAAELDAAKARAESYAAEAFSLRRELADARAARERAHADARTPPPAAVRASAEFHALRGELEMLASAHRTLSARAEREGVELRAERDAHRAAREGVSRLAESGRAALREAATSRGKELDELRKELAAVRADKEAVAARVDSTDARAAEAAASKARADAEAAKAKADAKRLRAARDELIGAREKAVATEVSLRAALARAEARAPDATAGSAAIGAPAVAAVTTAATAEAALADATDKLAAAEGARARLAAEVHVAREEHQALLSEIELISRSYEEGHEALRTLQAHADSKDALCSQLLAERHKAAALATALRDEKSAIVEKLAAAERLIDGQREVCGQLEAHTHALTAELEKRTEECRTLSAHHDKLRADFAEATKELHAKLARAEEVAAANERSASQLAEAQASTLEWRERAERGADATAEARRKLQRLQERLESGGTGDSMLHEEISLLRSKLKCPLCPRNVKEVCITSCGHTFCRECIDKRLNLRDRKCPTCMRPFSADKVLQIYLTSASS